MRAIILSGVAFIATTAVLALACPAHELADMEDECDGRHVTPVSPYDDRVALVCVLKCAPKRQQGHLRPYVRALVVSART